MKRTRAHVEGWGAWGSDDGVPFDPKDDVLNGHDAQELADVYARVWAKTSVVASTVTCAPLRDVLITLGLHELCNASLADAFDEAIDRARKLDDGGALECALRVAQGNTFVAAGEAAMKRFTPVSWNVRSIGFSRTSNDPTVVDVQRDTSHDVDHALRVVFGDGARPVWAWRETFKWLVPRVGARKWTVVETVLRHAERAFGPDEDVALLVLCARALVVAQTELFGVDVDARVVSEWAHAARVHTQHLARTMATTPSSFVSLANVVDALAREPDGAEAGERAVAHARARSAALAPYTNDIDRDASDVDAHVAALLLIEAVEFAPNDPGAFARRVGAQTPMSAVLDQTCSFLSSLGGDAHEVLAFCDLEMVALFEALDALRDLSLDGQPTYKPESVSFNRETNTFEPADNAFVQRTLSKFNASETASDIDQFRTLAATNIVRRLAPVLKRIGRLELTAINVETFIKTVLFETYGYDACVRFASDATYAADLNGRPEAEVKAAVARWRHDFDVGPNKWTSERRYEQSDTKGETFARLVAELASNIAALWALDLDGWARSFRATMDVRVEARSIAPERLRTALTPQNARALVPSDSATALALMRSSLEAVRTCPELVRGDGVVRMLHAREYGAFASRPAPESLTDIGVYVTRDGTGRIVFANGTGAGHGTSEADVLIARERARRTLAAEKDADGRQSDEITPPLAKSELLRDVAGVQFVFSFFSVRSILLNLQTALEAQTLTMLPSSQIENTDVRAFRERLDASINEIKIITTSLDLFDKMCGAWNAERDKVRVAFSRGDARNRAYADEIRRRSILSTLVTVRRREALDAWCSLMSVYTIKRLSPACTLAVWRPFELLDAKDIEGALRARPTSEKPVFLSANARTEWRKTVETFSVSFVDGELALVPERNGDAEFEPELTVVEVHVAAQDKDVRLAYWRDVERATKDIAPLPVGDEVGVSDERRARRLAALERSRRNDQETRRHARKIKAVLARRNGDTIGGDGDADGHVSESETDERARARSTFA